MSDQPRPYSVFYIRAWTAASFVFGLGMLVLFLAGNHFLHLGQIVWSLLRWLASPLI
jgi:hypothetical protein